MQLAHAALVALALCACSRSSSPPSSTEAGASAEWLTDPKTAAIPSAAVTGEIDGSAFTVHRVSFFTETAGWDMRVEGSNAASQTVIVNIKIREPVSAGHLFRLYPGR